MKNTNTKIGTSIVTGRPFIVVLPVTTVRSLVTGRTFSIEGL
jgi:hypothetical protein